MCCHVSRFSFGTRGERGYGEGSEDFLFFWDVLVCLHRGLGTRDWDNRGRNGAGASLTTARWWITHTRARLMGRKREGKMERFNTPAGHRDIYTTLSL